MRCGRGRLSEATRYSRHGATMPAVRSGCPGVCVEWSGIGRGRRWGHRRQGHAQRGGRRWTATEQDGKQMDASLSLVRSGCCAGSRCSVLSARCSTAVQKANGARSACQKPNNATQDLSNPQTASRNVPSRSRFTPCCCLDRRFYLPRTYDKPSPIKKVQIDSLGRPDKSAPTPILPLSPCSEPHSPNPGP